MKVLHSWLQEFLAEPVEPAVIAAAFDDLGTPVEEEQRIGEGLDGIVVARVLELRRHPNADRIQLVSVDAGDGEALQIACGAFNMAEGDLVPLATLGTTMPDGMAIERRKMRGEWSNGMLCSARELQLGEDHDGILVLDTDHPLGTPISDALGIEADVLWELEVNPNRPDAMSIIGLARDVAAKIGVRFRLPEPPRAVTAPAADLDWSSGGDGGVVEASADGVTTAVAIRAPEGCGRFVVRVLRGIDAEAVSPPWLQNRLIRLGMRPINAVVDISNHVMLELGQPNHPYDLGRLGGSAIGVRRARDGEVMTTLDDVERRLTAEDLLIVDGEDRPHGIAGIMGGADAEVGPETTEVLLEMAWFRPSSVNRTSRRLGLRSEASARFEKGADPGVIDLAADRFCQLAAEICGAETLDLQVDVRGELPERPPITVRTTRVNELLGTELDRDEIASLLAPIGFTPEAIGDDLSVDVPTWRFDSAVEIDVVEEIARHLGYRDIPNRALTAARRGGLTERQKRRRGVRRLLCGLGLAEVQPLPFLAPGQLAATGLDPDGIELVNPLVADESVLRTSLMPGLVGAVSRNEARRQLGVGLWEIGHVFLPPPEGQLLPDELEHVAVVLAGRDATAAVETWTILAEQLRLLEPAVENAELPGLHPTRGARATVDGVTVGVVGEIDPAVLRRHDIDTRVAYLEIDLGRCLDGPRRSDTYRQISRFPSNDIDLAFTVSDEVSATTVERTLRDADDLVWSVRLFDVYRGEPVTAGARSLAYAVRLQAPDRTLDDAEVATIRSRLIGAVEDAHGARLRG